MITIVDYGMGNVGSVFNMLRKLRVKVQISSDMNEIAKSDKLILPGVGHFDRGMDSLNSSGLARMLSEQVLVNKKPILGICLGMQMMTRGSEEGTQQGLGWVAADTIKFSFDSNLKIPHMGWNQVKSSIGAKLFESAPEEPERFYFVHSYYVRADNPKDVAAYCHYGHDFVASFEVGNIMGVQFHPEKSHLFGMNLFQRFVAL
ncbi:MAG TPA: imidazole glycerol phosphate synthase subunit HisH [Methylotenera sp.]|nr:imidazole glycerol phosphate synthase subunit HisH [Methylotenera sp.]